MMRRRLHLPGNVDDLARQLEQIYQEIPHETIRDIENRFLEQKATEEKLVELKKMFSKTLYDLKTEKKQLDSRMELLRGANAGCPKRELEDELKLAKSRLEEQEKRITNARMELDKIAMLLSNADGLTQKLEQAIRKKLPGLKRLRLLFYVIVLKHMNNSDTLSQTQALEWHRRFRKVSKTANALDVHRLSALLKTLKRFLWRYVRTDFKQRRDQNESNQFATSFLLP
ncbi:uncharacterized protein TNCV_2143261 [Trichonephila clavipes]|nr:uncharacterized protein TNCV_2143261 [Trichonephila clavipes]